ncbi:MAG: type 4a pilus biogenesis protein PilO [Candidatus Omnitrophica bacterium]|nr:type 4a pilus biogenesis protein PilO [Candidatus Omnitrophota bacterium]
MVQLGQIDKYKNKIINLVIILIALLIALNIYKDRLAQIESLKVKISEEAKKNNELEKIARMKLKINSYKELLTKREASLVMADLSEISKGAEVKVLSVKPYQKESAGDYNREVFEVNINAPSYDSLGKFINALESYKNVYMVDGIDISSQGVLNKKGLTVNLHISSVALTDQ